MGRKGAEGESQVKPAERRATAVGVQGCAARPHCRALSHTVDGESEVRDTGAP